MSAPTTAEVREMADSERDAVCRETTAYGAGVKSGRVKALVGVALPLAEHRDALAAERDDLQWAVAVVVRTAGIMAGPADTTWTTKHLLRLATALQYQIRSRDREADALAAEVARLRSVLGSIATLDESDTDDLTEALTNWDAADVYGSLGAAITSARMALDDAAKGAGR